jgi:GNAT superfamily N-acetyltransferase
MQTKARVRTVELQDSAALEGLFVALGYPAPQSAIRKRLTRLRSDPTYAAWVAVQDEPIVGFASGHIVHPVEDNPAAQLVALVIAPRHERTGAGTALSNEFETRACSNGASRVLVTSGEQRRGAHTLYKHRGYAPTGLRFNKTLREDIGALGIGRSEHQDPDEVAP